MTGNGACGPESSSYPLCEELSEFEKTAKWMRERACFYLSHGHVGRGRVWYGGKLSCQIRAIRRVGLHSHRCHRAHRAHLSSRVAADAIDGVVHCCARVLVLSRAALVDVSHHSVAGVVGDDWRESFLELFLLLAVFGSSILEPDLLQTRVVVLLSAQFFL